MTVHDSKGEAVTEKTGQKSTLFRGCFYSYWTNLCLQLIPIVLKSLFTWFIMNSYNEVALEIILELEKN